MLNADLMNWILVRMVFNDWDSINELVGLIGELRKMEILW